jgi:pimeloyl-ACP methyl ester carboxylesterase
VVALLFAARNPTMVDRLLATGFPVNGSAIHPRLRSAAPAELADWLLSKNPSADAARSETSKTDPNAIAASLDDLQRADITSMVAALATPCLFVHGQNDPAVEMISNESAAALPESMHYIVFEQSGHFPMLDETNKYNRLLNDFLSLASGESPRQLQLKEEWKRRIR